MKSRHILPALLLILFSCAAPAAAQRTAFPRQKFDRSRFERPDPATPLASATTATAPAAAVEPAEEPAAEPLGDSSWQSGAEPAGGSSWKTGAEDTNPTSVFSANASLPDSPPPPTYWKGITPEETAAYNSPLWDEIPGKLYNNAKDFEELQALQKKLGACLIIYFKNPTISNQKGLCNWYEKTVTKDMKWRIAMRSYIKLEILLPGNKATQALAELFHVSHTPNVTVLQPGATRGTYLKLFDYEQGKRPVPREADDVLKQLKDASTPAYAPRFN